MKVMKIEIKLSSDQLNGMKEKCELEEENDPLFDFLLYQEKRRYFSDDYAFSNQDSVRYELLKTDIKQNKLVLLLKN